MATYNAGDFVGKTIFITSDVPVYKYATASGSKRPNPVAYLKAGDGFFVDSFINKNGAYTTFDDNYWQGKFRGSTIVVSFSDVAGKYDAAPIVSQGVKSNEQKKKEQQEQQDGVLLTTVKKYLPWALGTMVLVAIIKKS